MQNASHEAIGYLKFHFDIFIINFVSIIRMTISIKG